MRKNLKKIIGASFIVGSLNFMPTVYDFDESQMIFSVVQAAIQTYTAKDTAMMDFGEDDPQMVNTVKAVAKMRAEQAAREQAGVYLTNYSKENNGMLTENDIEVLTNNIVDVVDVQYKKLPYEAHNAKGTSYGKVGFMYEATATVKIDMDGISKYVKRDEKEKNTLSTQAKVSQQTNTDINKNFEDLREQSQNANTVQEQEEIKTKVQSVDNDILVSQLIQEGAKLQYQRDYQGAVSKYNEAIRINPNYSAAYISRANAYKYSGQFDNATKDYDKAVELDPNNVNIYNSRGDMYLNYLGKKDKAVEDLGRAIELDPNSSSNYSTLGYLYKELKQYDNALKMFDKMLELNPKDTHAYHGRATIHETLKNYDAAIEDFSKAIEINPEYHFDYFCRGEIYKQLNQYDKAIADYTKAIETVDDNSTSAYNKVALYKYRSELYQKLKQYDKAVADLTEAIEIEKNLGEKAKAYKNRGELYFSMKQFENANADFEKSAEFYTKAIETDSKNAEKYYKWRALLYRDYRVKKYDLALEDYKKSIELNPYDYFAYMCCAEIYKTLKDYANAILYYTKAAEIRPGYQEIYDSRGEMYVEIQQYENAVADYTKYIEIRPAYYKGYYERAEVYEKMGQNEKAVADYTKAIEVSFNAPQKFLFTSRGELYKKMKQYDKAIADFTKAIELDPKYKYSYKNRGECYQALGDIKKAQADFEKFESL